MLQHAAWHPLHAATLWALPPCPATTLQLARRWETQSQTSPSEDPPCVAAGCCCLRCMPVSPGQLLREGRKQQPEAGFLSIESLPADSRRGAGLFLPVSSGEKSLRALCNLHEPRASSLQPPGASCLQPPCAPCLQLSQLEIHQCSSRAGVQEQTTLGRPPPNLPIPSRLNQIPPLSPPKKTPPTEAGATSWGHKVLQGQHQHPKKR